MLRRLINFMVLGIVLLGAVALVLLGPRPFAAVLPERVELGLEGLVGPDGLLRRGAVRPGATPQDFLSDGPGGPVVDGPVAAAAGNQPVFIDTVLAGHATALDDAIPAEIMTIRPILGCLLTPPQPGTLVGHAVAGAGGLPLPLVSYDDADLAEGVRQFVERYRKSTAATPAEVPGIAYRAYDVVVTEASAPVYLVLSSGPGNRIWNIHQAEGVRIERVILLGGAQAGVANLDPVVPVEVLLDDGLAGCGIVPAGPGTVATGSSAVTAYEVWFRDSFGTSARDSRAGFQGGQVSLIGPVPAEAVGRAPYRSIAGARVRMTEDTYAEIRGQVPGGQDFAARVLAITTGFAMGDLATLRQGVGF